MVLLSDVGEVEACSVRFNIVLISTQDWCTICAERAIVSEVMLGAPDGTPRLHGSSGGSFQSIVLTSTQDRCTVCAKCTIGSEISFDAPDGTPR